MTLTYLLQIFIHKGPWCGRLPAGSHGNRNLQQAKKLLPLSTGEEHNSSRFVFRENHTHAPQYGEEVRGEKQDGKQSREREREEKGKEGGRVERRGGGGEWQMNL